MSIDNDSLKSFLEYKKSKVDSSIEADAIPTSIIDSTVGVFASLKTLLGLWILLPISFFLILIHFLADNLDRKKHSERLEIIEYTEDALQEIEEQEIGLLANVSEGG
jgi:hypothetical protein